MNWAIFRPRRSIPRVHSFHLCFFFYCELRPSGVSLESPGLQNIIQVPANRAKVAQNNDTFKAVCSILSVLKWSEAVFRPRSSTRNVHSFYLCPFHWNVRPSGVSLESSGVEHIHKLRQIEPKLLKMTMRVMRFGLLFQSLNEVGLYFGLEAWHRACDPFTCVHFTEN